MKKVSFDIKVENNNIKSSEKKIYPRYKKNTKKIKFKKNYTCKKALNVGIRLHKEIENAKQFEKRQCKEKLVEQLLIYNKMYLQVNKVYRLSDEKINILLQRLITVKYN